MAAVIYENALREFNAAIEDVRRYSEFVGLANQIRPRVGNLIDWQATVGEAKNLITKFMKRNEYQMAVGYNGVVVLLASEFEKLVRRLVTDGVGWINKAVRQYEVAEALLMQRHLTYSGYALSTIKDPSVEIPYDYQLLCRNIGTCRTGGGEMQLNADVFASRITNTNKSKIDEAFDRICLSIDWDVVADDNDVKTLTGEASRHRAAIALEKWLLQFMRDRNKIAHNGVTGAATTEQELDKATRMLAALGRSLAGHIEGILIKKYKLPAGSK